MSTIVFAILLYKMRRCPEDQKNSDVFKLLYYGDIALLVLSFFSFGSPAIWGMAILAIIVAQIYKKKSGDLKKDQNQRYNFSGQAYENTANNTKAAREYESARATSRGRLPKSANGRRAQIVDFDKRYQLYLTDEQIDSIVNSTYLSEIWKHEVEAMGEKYENVYQWFVGPTAWLRIYIHAFIPQEITSDFAQQEKIAIYSFDQVFTYAEQLGNIPLAEKIKACNEKFFAQFDDISFMAAFRYLESRGIKHNLTVADPVSASSTIDDLAKKYESVEA